MLEGFFPNRNRPTPVDDANRRPAREALEQALKTLTRDPYLHLADTELRLISVFDDLQYDRSDLDMMAPPMRQRVSDRLQALGCTHRSGSVLVANAADVRFIFPKFRALGASPFDAGRGLDRRQQDFLLLTPTQTAAQLIDAYPHEVAVERVKSLIKAQPINLYRLLDFLEDKPTHNEFRQAIGHLRYIQRKAVASEPLCRRRALGTIA